MQDKNAKAETVKYRIGCQSWGYDDWVTTAGGETVFYPRGTRRDEMLELYSRIFDTIEVDATVYGIPPPSTMKKWYEQTPDGFTFSLKVPREITHKQQLRGTSLAVMNEFVRTASVLNEKLAAILIQFPASFELTTENREAFENFIQNLPTGFRFAVEFRNPAWLTGAMFDLLNRYGICLCFVEGKWAARDVYFAAATKMSSSWQYIRLMGERDLTRFDRIYRPQDKVIYSWCDEIKKLAAKDIFIYVDNYFEGFSPESVNKVRSCLGLPAMNFEILEPQGSLF